MSNFSYKKRFIITDKQARDLRLTIETPVVNFYQNTNGKVYLTAHKMKMHNYCYSDVFDCTLTETNWIIDMFFPFPWEDTYAFIRKSKGLYQLMNREIEEKECIKYVKPTVKTLPTTRRRKIKEIQSMCEPEPSTYGQNPDLFDTLR